MKKEIILTLVLGLCIAGSSLWQASGKGKDDNRPVKGKGQFVTRHGTVNSQTDGICIEAPVIVEIIDGNKFTYEISGYENQLDLIGIENVGNQLQISTIPKNLRFPRKHPVRIVITAPDILRSVEASHLSQVELKKPIRSQDFSLSGASMTHIGVPDLDVERLTIHVESMGKLSATGQAEHMELTVSGMGRARLKELSVTDAQCDISGMGRAKVQVIGQLNGTTEGMGRLIKCVRPATENVTSSSRSRVRGK